MKKVMMLLLAATLSATTLFAQKTDSAKEKKSPEEKAKMKTERLDKKLNLTDEQEAKVEQIYLVSAQKMTQLKDRKGADKKAMGQELKAIRENTDQQLKTVLTPEQMAMKEKMDAERKKKHKNHKGKGHSKGKHNPNAEKTGPKG